ncbi:MAG: TetR family transcriptional regulator [Phycisphaerae bacterium]|nr:MAG: TetR/AcrR family transcriptional regulator [Planctomycetia bacterium]RIK71608.1 MAG: TetR/AcrR family transcriptional regulator [Planctomycetota bacterium]GJQ25810.1 MAG: TetR family transcriptional regulator [Phycisphaerae bacterium]
MSLAMDRKAEIHRVACRLFREKGFAGTSVREIAEQVGILGGSLYSHIAGKDDLLWEILAASAERFFAAIRPIVEADWGAMQKLRAAIVAHVGVITCDLDAAAVYTFEWRHLPEDRRAAFTARRDEYERLFRGLVEQAMRERFIGASSAASATLFILSALNWVSVWYRPDGPMSGEDVGAMLADYLFEGLKRRTA